MIRTSSIIRLRSVRALSLLSSITACVLAGNVAAQDYVTLSIPERAGVARASECAVFGVPVPRSWNITNTSTLCVRDATSVTIPAQFDVLARWGSNPSNSAAPIKWVLVSLLQNVNASATNSLVLYRSGTPASPATSISMDTATAGHILVNTGAALFDINTNSFNLFNQVTISGQTVLESLSQTAAIAYSPMGATDVVPGDSPDLTPRVISVAIERSGPLFAVIKVKGSILNAGAQAVLDYTARLYFYAGSANVRMDFTVENNHPVLVDGMGQPSNAHSLGAVNSVYIGALRLNLRLRNSGEQLRVLTEQGADVAAPAAPVMLYQDSSGGTNWDAYVGMVGWPGYEMLTAPRLQSYCTLPGYQITGAGSVLSGSHAQGWMTVFRGAVSGPRVTVAVRDFAENFPKALEAATDGTLSVNLFPDGSKFRHNFRVGEQKTHSILFRFGLAPASAAESAQISMAFDRPLFGAAPGAWHSSCGTIGDAPAFDLTTWPLYERYVRIAFEPNPDAPIEPALGNGTLTNVIEKYNFLGWQDYGDVPIDYESFGDYQAGQMNLKYWYTLGMLVQFCRSAEFRWMDLAFPATRHISDIDFEHIPDEGVQHWSHGAYYGHSQHDEPGNTNPNRNYNSPSVDLVFGIPDLTLAYCLTGEVRFRDVALEGLEGLLSMSAFSDFTAPVATRERANLITAYIDGYRMSGDPRWLAELRTIVGQTCTLTNKTWLTNPAAYGAEHPGEFLSGFMISQVLWALGKYLDFSSEYSMSDDLGVATALGSYSDFLLAYCTTEYASGRSAILHEYYFDRSEASELDINSWALTTGDALAYAYKYTSQQRYLTEAAKFYATGTVDPHWLDDEPVYWDTKDLVNSLVWGLVYMKLSQGSSPTPPPTPPPEPPAGRARLDMDADGDGRADMAVFDNATGSWYIRSVAGSTILWASAWGWPSAQLVVGDYDGDHRSDLAVFDDPSGAWYIRTVAESVLAWGVPWGWPGAIPVTGDYDADGICDLAVFDGNTGYWYVYSLDGSVIAWAVPWGWPGAVPVPGRYDADAQSDLAVYDSNTGYWYVYSLTGSVIAWAIPWGWPGAITVPGDYDGDGLSDLAVYDSNTGYWYVYSLTGSVVAWGVPWGWPGAIPVYGDFNGDSRNDLAVYDSNTGYWYIYSLDGTVIAWAEPWGWPGATVAGGRTR